MNINFSFGTIVYAALVMVFLIYFKYTLLASIGLAFVVMAAPLIVMLAGVGIPILALSLLTKLYK